MVVHIQRGVPFAILTYKYPLAIYRGMYTQPVSKKRYEYRYTP